MTVDRFLDDAVLGALPADEFVARSPFPWHSFNGALRPEAFDALLADFPPIEMFVWREGLRGQYYTRPHDRWFLEYSAKGSSTHGYTPKAGLPVVWQRFIDEIETSESYRKNIVEWLGRDDYEVRMTWHLGVNGSEVSPHRDTDEKYGTQIFYFNTPDDWDPAWGGEIKLLVDKPKAVKNPYFGDFGSETDVDTLGNRSFLFKNTALGMARGAAAHLPTRPVPPVVQRRVRTAEGRARARVTTTREARHTRPPPAQSQTRLTVSRRSGRR